jgi:O-antigen/teichoic acid export membrane protein
MINYINQLLKKTIIKRYLNLLSVDIIIRALNFCLLPIYLKLMTQAEYGLYGYLLSIIAVFSSVLNFGFYNAQTKLYHDFQGKEKGSVVFTINFILNTFLLCILAPTYFLKLDYKIVKLLFAHPIPYDSYRLVVLLGIIVSIYSIMIINYFVTSEKIKHIQIYNLLKAISINSIVIFLLYKLTTNTILIRLSFSYFIELFLILGFIIYFWRKKLFFKFNFSICFKSLKIGIPLMMGSLIGVFYQFSDKYILEKVTDFNMLAIYNLGIVFSSVVYIVFANFQHAYLPIFLKEKNPIVNINRTNKIAKGASFSLFIVGIITVLGFKILLYFNVFNKEFEMVLYLLPILLLYRIISSITHFYSNYLLYFEMTYIGVFVGVATNILNIYLNIKWIPLYGVFGAAYATLLVSILSFAFYYIFAMKKCRKQS